MYTYIDIVKARRREVLPLQYSSILTVDAYSYLDRLYVHSHQSSTNQIKVVLGVCARVCGYLSYSHKYVVVGVIN